MKKKKEQKIQRKIYRDFTVEEFDVFTLDVECQGAKHERNAVVEELLKAQINLQNYSNEVGGPESKRVLEGIVSGVKLAVGLIRKMPEYEDRCECSQCGDYDE